MSSNRLKSAAMVIKCLPKKQAAMVLSRLDGADVKQIIGVLSDLCITDQQMVASVGALQNELGLGEPANGMRSKERHTGQSCHDQPSGCDPMAEVYIEPCTRFAFVEGLKPKLRARLLAEQHPRNIAAVLIEISPKVATCLLSRIDSKKRLNVVRRLCMDVYLDEQEKTDLVSSLKLRLNQISDQCRDVGRPRSNANQVVASDDKTQDFLPRQLNLSSPDPSRRGIDPAMSSVTLSFDQLHTVTDAEIKRLLSSVDTSLWAPALKFALLATRRKVMDNMADLVADILRAEIRDLKQMDELTANLAQRKIMTAYSLMLNDEFDSSSDAA